MSDNEIIISIIVPSFNEFSYIRGCLNSLINQTYDKEKYEIIVVDGMSDDGTRDIINEFIRKFDQIRLIDNVKKTAPVAMNIGIKEAKGDYIVRIDAHVEIPAYYLERCAKVMAHTEADVVGGPIETRGNGFWGKMIAYILSSIFGVGSSFRTLENYSGYVDTVAFGLYKRSILETVGPHDEDLVRGHDWEINQRIIRNGGRIFIDPSIRSIWYCADNPIKLIKKSFKDGYWIAAIFEKHSFRHLAPLFYCLSLIFLGVACYWRRGGRGSLNYVFFPLWSYLLLYYMVAFFYSLGMIRVSGWYSIIIGPFLYASFHLSRGLGTLYGLMSCVWLRTKPE